MKARNFKEAVALEHIPNIGKRVGEDLRLIGITKPVQLKNKDPFELYQKLCKKMGFKIDPCMIDVLMSAVDFANGADPKPWWFYTPERKRLLSKSLARKKTLTNK